MKWRFPTFWALAWGGGGGLFSNRSATLFSAHEWAPESCPNPFVPRTGVSVARCAAVTARVCNVPVLTGDEPLPEGYRVEEYIKVKLALWYMINNENKKNVPRPIAAEGDLIESPVVDCVLPVFSCETRVESYAGAVVELRPTCLSRCLTYHCHRQRHWHVGVE